MATRRCFWLLAASCIGFVFGAVVFKTNYCAMGSLSDIYNFADYRRFRAWLLAAATALLGAQLLQSLGITALDKSMYLTPSLNWAGHGLGGIIFGIGMVFAGGCPSRNLARAGAGDLRSLMTLVVLGLTAYVTIGGLLGPLRALLERTTAVILPLPGQGLGHLLAAVLQTIAHRGRAGGSSGRGGVCSHLLRQGQKISCLAGAHCLGLGGRRLCDRRLGADGPYL